MVEPYLRFLAGKLVASGLLQAKDGSRRPVVVAMDPDTGGVLWTLPVERFWCFLQTAGERLFVASTGRRLDSSQDEPGSTTIQALDASSGKIHGSRTLSGGLDELKSVGGKLLCKIRGSGGPREACRWLRVDPVSLQVLWTWQSYYPEDESLIGDLLESKAGLLATSHTTLFRLRLSDHPGPDASPVEVVWKFSPWDTSKRGPSSILSYGGYEERLTATDGKTIWRVFDRRGPLCAIDARTGKGVWTVDRFTSDVECLSLSKNLLLLHTRGEREFNYLLVLDASTGKEIDQILSEPDLRSVTRAGPWFLLPLKTNRLVAVHPERTARREPQSVSDRVADALRAYQEKLESRVDRDDLQCVASRIERIGPGAKPSLLTYLDSKDDVLRAASSYALLPFADPSDLPLLRPVLEKAFDMSPEAFPRERLITGLLETFSAHKDGEIAPLLRERILSSDRDIPRAEMMMALANIGTPQALSTYDEFRSRASQGTRPVLQFPDRDAGPYPMHYTGPRPPKIGRPPFLSYEHLLGRWTVSTSREDGSEWIVFHDPILGGARDIWLTYRRKGGVWSQPIFTGLTGLKVDSPPVKMLIRDDRIVFAGQFRAVATRPSQPPPQEYHGAERILENPSVVVTEISADEDADGLTDLVEARLGSDPSGADTDRDAILDPDDHDILTPWSGKEEDEAAEIITEAHFLWTLQGRPERRLELVATPFLGGPPMLRGLNGFVWNNPPPGMRQALGLAVGHDGYMTVGFGSPLLSRFERTDDGERSPIQYLNTERTVAELELGYDRGHVSFDFSPVVDWNLASIRLSRARDRWYVVDLKYQYLH